MVFHRFSIIDVILFDVLESKLILVASYALGTLGLLELDQDVQWKLNWRRSGMQLREKSSGMRLLSIWVKRRHKWWGRNVAIRGLRTNAVGQAWHQHTDPLASILAQMCRGERLSRGDAADIQSAEIMRYDWTSCQAHESGPKETSGLSTR